VPITGQFGFQPFSIQHGSAQSVLATFCQGRPPSVQIVAHIVTIPGLLAAIRLRLPRGYRCKYSPCPARMRSAFKQQYHFGLVRGQDGACNQSDSIGLCTRRKGPREPLASGKKVKSYTPKEQEGGQFPGCGACKNCSNMATAGRFRSIFHFGIGIAHAVMASSLMNSGLPRASTPVL
jgi:hypothetical protein